MFVSVLRFYVWKSFIIIGEVKRHTNLTLFGQIKVINCVSINAVLTGLSLFLQRGGSVLQLLLNDSTCVMKRRRRSGWWKGRTELTEFSEYLCLGVMTMDLASINHCPAATNRPQTNFRRVIRAARDPPTSGNKKTVRVCLSLTHFLSLLRKSLCRAAVMTTSNTFWLASLDSAQFPLKKGLILVRLLSASSHLTAFILCCVSWFPLSPSSLHCSLPTSSTKHCSLLHFTGFSLYKLWICSWSSDFISSNIIIIIICL